MIRILVNLNCLVATINQIEEIVSLVSHLIKIYLKLKKNHKKLLLLNYQEG